MTYFHFFLFSPNKLLNSVLEKLVIMLCGLLSFVIKSSLQEIKDVKKRIKVIFKIFLIILIFVSEFFVDG